MGSDPAFSTVEAHSGGLGGLWRSLGQLWFGGLLGHLWFSALADTAGARNQARQAQADHAALKPTQPYAQVLRAIQDDPDCHLVDRDPALGEQVLLHAACFDATWSQLRGEALAQARYLRLYCVRRFRPFRMVYTFDLQAHEISRHGLPGAQWHREVPYALW